MAAEMARQAAAQIWLAPGEVAPRTSVLVEQSWGIASLLRAVAVVLTREPQMRDREGMVAAWLPKQTKPAAQQHKQAVLHWGKAVTAQDSPAVVAAADIMEVFSVADHTEMPAEVRVMSEIFHPGKPCCVAHPVSLLTRHQTVMVAYGYQMETVFPEPSIGHKKTFQSRQVHIPSVGHTAKTVP